MNVTDSAVRRAYALGRPSGYGRSAEEGALARVAAENEFDDWLAEHDAALLARAEAAEAVIAEAVTIIRRDQERLANLDPTELLVALGVYARAVSHPEPTEETGR